MKNICDWNNCSNEGLYRAPKERDNSKNYSLIINHINKIGLKSKFKKLLNIKHLNKIIMHMGLDKKNNSKKINLILIKNFGKIKTDFQIDPSKLKRFIKSELNK